MHESESSGGKNRTQIHDCQMEQTEFVQTTHKVSFCYFCHHIQMHRIWVWRKRYTPPNPACAPKLGSAQGMHQLCFLQTLGEVKQPNILFRDAVFFSFSLLIFGSDISWLTFNTSAANQKFIKTSRRQEQPAVPGEHGFIHKLFKTYSLLRSKHEAVTVNPSLPTQDDYPLHLETTQ